MNYTTWKRIMARRKIGTPQTKKPVADTGIEEDVSKEDIRKIVHDLDNRVTLLEIEVQNIARR